MPLKCIIADDEPLALELMRLYAGRHPGLDTVATFTSAEDALRAIQAGGIDLAFLDIQMPHLSGLEVAAAAREAGVRVVFVTAYRDFAVEGFRLNALDYLLKPVSYEEFSEAVERAVGAIAPAEMSEPEFITVRSDYRQVRVDLADIAYVEGLKDYVKIYTASRPRPLITQLSLKAVEAMLPTAAFVRVHRSYIVSLQAIESYGRTHARIAGTDIPVGDTYRARFLEAVSK